MHAPNHARSMPGSPADGRHGPRPDPPRRPAGAPEALNRLLYMTYNGMIAKVLKWGNSYGIRLSKEEAERAGLKPGDEVVVEVKAREGQTIDLSDLPGFDLGGDLAERHDEVWADAVVEERRRKGRRGGPADDDAGEA